LTPDLAKEFNLPEETDGVLVEEVTPGSAAAKAGLKDGDVITEFNGKKLADDRNLRLMVAQTTPGTKVDLRLLRGQAGHKPKIETVAATLDRQPEDLFAARTESGQAKPKERAPSNLDALEGVEVTDLDARMRRQFEIPEEVQGALVASVEQDSNAAEAGLQRGDVILEIDHHPLQNADAAVDLSDKAKGDQILLRVWRQGRKHYVPVDNTKHK
jgi:serine protease Do